MGKASAVLWIFFKKKEAGKIKKTQNINIKI
jgi:hypothetical protein